MDLPVSAIRLVQAGLKTKGLYAGEIDGVAGPKTYAAAAQALSDRQGDILANQRRNWQRDWSDQRKLTAYYQIMIKDKGLSTGPVDGIWGPLTGEAHQKMTENLDSGMHDAPQPSSPAATAGNFTFLFNTAAFNTVMSGIMELNEARADQIYKLSHARLAKSGYSIGRTQTDFGVRAQARAELVEFLSARLQAGQNEIAAIKSALAVRGNPDALSATQLAAINTVLNTPEGHALVEKWDNNNFQEMLDISRNFGEAAARNPFFGISDQFNAYARGIVCATLIADNGNQFGSNQGTLQSWATGQDVRLNGVLVPRPPAEFGFRPFASLECQYKYVRDTEGGARDIARRRKNIMDVLQKQGHLDNDTHDENLAVIRALYIPASQRPSV